ncbi:MAG: 26S proteasome non-ATPase regulatory subunit 6 [Paramarteilia canceri]
MHSGWEEKNRFKVYKGLYYLTQSKFSEASHILLETIATFNTTELLSYEDLVCYTVSVAMLALPRRQLKKKCVDGQEIQESLYGTPLVKNFLKSLYSCQYSEFLVNLAQIEQELKKSLFMGCVYYIYIDQIRAVAYSQLLESYSSISLDFMADTFGVTPEFIDEEVSYYISKNMISCQIDKLSRTINTLEPQIKNEQFSKVISSGDSLLDKLQKLLKKVQTV